MNGSSTPSGTKDVTGTFNKYAETDSSMSGKTSGLTGGQTSLTSDMAAAVPDWLKPFLTQAIGTAGQGLTQFGKSVGEYVVPQAATDQLTKTAEGAYLYGGPEQQAFIDAAVRGASPGIFSQFGAAGRAGSGLEDAALNQSAVDAYARLYQGERANQLSAAGQLPGISMLPLELQRQLATLAGGLPGQFAPFLGQQSTQTGAQSGFTSGKTSGKQSIDTHEYGKEIESTPMYEDPWWKAALGGVSTLGSMFIPGAGGISAAGNLLGMR